MTSLLLQSDMSAARLGFENAPVTLGLMEIIGGITGFFFLFPISNAFTFKHLFPDVLPGLALWRPFTNLMFFSSFVDALLGLLLLYNFRDIERMFGSAKFSAFLLFTTVLSFLLEVSAMSFLSFDNPAGPYFIIFAIATMYAILVPWTDRFSLFGINFSNKIYTYLICLQFLYLRSPGSIVPCVCGILASIVFHYDLLINKNKIILPSVFRNLGVAIAPTLGIDLNPRQRRPRQIVVNAPPQRIPQAPRAPANVRAPRAAQQPRPQIAQPTEENIATVSAMGFSRQQAVFALQMANNNVQLATNLLVGNN